MKLGDEITVHGVTMTVRRFKAKDFQALQKIEQDTGLPRIEAKLRSSRREAEHGSRRVRVLKRRLQALDERLEALPGATPEALEVGLEADVLAAEIEEVELDEQAMRLEAEDALWRQRHECYLRMFCAVAGHTDVEGFIADASGDPAAMNTVEETLKLGKYYRPLSSLLMESERRSMGARDRAMEAMIARLPGMNSKSAPSPQDAA